MMNPPSLVYFFWVTIAVILLVETNAEVEQCQNDCRQSPPFRLVGPTRPWHDKDLLGNDLLLTKSYPYAMAGSYLDLVRFNISYECIYEHSRTATIKNKDGELFQGEKGALLEDITYTVKRTTNSSFDLEMLKFALTNNDSNGSNDNSTSITTIGMSIRVDIVVESDLESSHALLVDRIETNLKGIIANHERNEIKLGEEYFVIERRIKISHFDETRILHAGQPNPYSQFCELGCAYFYSSPNDPLHISECTNKCDEYYKYNVTVEYIDFIEVARLECRDGCQIGLMRCQPGYNCSQIQSRAQEEGGGFEGGWMRHCPAGTYRDVSYDAVEECIPCPPGRFREDIKGRSLEGCSKCPAGTYNGELGISTIRGCHRCPAGTFTNEPGSESCICITPAACNDEFISPGDAEKRETVPFIGRW